MALMFLIMEKNSMRPKGSGDKTKRKRKIILSGLEERNLINDYENNFTTKDLMNKYGVTKSYISNLFSRRNVPKRIDHSYIKSVERINDIESLDKDISGVYAIYFLWKYDQDDSAAFSKVNDIRIYIGSSTNIKQRLKDHLHQLNNNTHYNKLLGDYFNNKEYSVHCGILKRCKPEHIMQEERAYQHKFNRSCLLNSWLATNEADLLPWLQKVVKSKSYNDYTINKENGCWECNTVHKSGYGRVSVVAFKDWGAGIRKHFSSHRVAYWEKYGEYPELVRHKCGNSKCRNPDHLIKGNHRDNALDKRGNFPEIFEKQWLEFRGNVVKLTEYFGWKPNCCLKDAKVSASVYEWEKKLNLRDKHPEVLRNNSNRKSFKSI